MNTPKVNKINVNPKALQISKEQSTLMAIVATATVITVFCLMSSKALLGQAAYQRRVINARHQSANQLNSDIDNANNLANQYNNVFIGKDSQNIIGGINDSKYNSFPPNGDNGNIVLDALPKVYDFPALLTSMSVLLSENSIGSPSIGGTDQSTTLSNSPSGKPTATPIDITVSGTGTYQASEQLVKTLESSIRPFDVTHLSLGGSGKSLSIDLDLTTYYQQAKTVNITSKEIK